MLRKQVNTSNNYRALIAKQEAEILVELVLFIDATM
jgi:hypothetical protein